MVDRNKFRLIPGGKHGDGQAPTDGGGPMDPYERRFLAIEKELAVIDAKLEHFATKEDVANLKFTMLVASIGIVGTLFGLIKYFT